MKEISLKELKQPKYSIYVMGLSFSSIDNVTIDNSVALIPSPYGVIHLCPFRKKEQLTYTKAVFYANCISFDTDCISFVHPLRKEIYCHNYKPIEYYLPFVEYPGITVSKKEFKVRMKRDLFEKLLKNVDIYEIINEFKKGICITLFPFEMTNLEYTNKYGKVAQALSLYSMALKQSDFLSEFLCYYRVLENLTKNNAKKLVAEYLKKLPSYKFGCIKITDISCSPAASKNLLSIYRMSALKRLHILRKKFGFEDEIAEYLYNENRCGIAHGKFGVKTTEYNYDYFSIGKDNFIMKLLCRMAIMEEIRKT